MTLSIALIVCLAIFLIGIHMVQKVGNYETIWGAMLFGGGVLTIILALIKMVTLL